MISFSIFNKNHFALNQKVTCTSNFSFSYEASSQVGVASHKKREYSFVDMCLFTWKCQHCTAQEEQREKLILHYNSYKFLLHTCTSPENDFGTFFCGPREQFITIHKASVTLHRSIIESKRLRVAQHNSSHANVTRKN